LVTKVKSKSIGHSVEKVICCLCCYSHPPSCGIPRKKWTNY